MSYYGMLGGIVHSERIKKLEKQRKEKTKMKMYKKLKRKTLEKEKQKQKQLQLQEDTLQQDLSSCLDNMEDHIIPDYIDNAKYSPDLMDRPKIQNKSPNLQSIESYSHIMGFNKLSFKKSKRKIGRSVYRNNTNRLNKQSGESEIIKLEQCENTVLNFMNKLNDTGKKQKQPTQDTNVKAQR